MDIKNIKKILKHTAKEVEEMFKSWMKWTFLEALTRTISKVFQKIIGTISHTFGHVLFAALIVGFVQVIGGFILAKVKHQKIITDIGSIAGSCLFGFNACLCTILPFYVFVLGGDIGINTFIITLSIIPGALIDVIFFKHKLELKQWMGIFIAVFAGYFILGTPSLSEFMSMPLWVWLSFIIAIIIAINQGITQKIKKIDPFVKNFWGGLTTLVISFIALSFWGSLDLLTNFSPQIQKLWLASIVVGLIVIAMWTYNLLSYKEGAHIAIKKLVMNGSYLTIAMFCGIVIFNEPLNFAKISGVLLYLVAFSFMDKGTNEYLAKISGLKTT
ncbi:hypothetical protein K8R32_01360 [bacterium]|nr:hypothetical protein [bacterium]